MDEFEDNFKEFAGKDLDSAIEEACLYFNAGRERLEIEIVQDATSGLFGLFGGHKAKVRARRAHLRDTVESVLGDVLGSDHGSHHPRRQPGDVRKAPRAEAGEAGRKRTPTEGAPGRAAERQEQRERAGRAEGAERPGRTDKNARSERGARADRADRADRPDRPVAAERKKTGGRAQNVSQAAEGAAPGTSRPAQDESGEEQVFGSHLEEKDVPEALCLAQRLVTRLLSPLTDAPLAMQAHLAGGEIVVVLTDTGDFTCLPGRDGQIAAAVQHIASRLVSRAMKAGVRVRLEVQPGAGQRDEDLAGLALDLAEKAAGTGRTISTRPLDAGQRRVVMQALDKVEGVQARCVGQGPMKRVLVQKRKVRQQRQEKTGNKAAAETQETAATGRDRA